MTSATTAPTTEIGYATNATIGWWNAPAEEQTPELRWPHSVAVYDQMRRQDAQVASVLRAVTYPVRRTPWRLDPAGARDEVVALVAEDLGLPIRGQDEQDLPRRRTRDRFVWGHHLQEALLSLPMGHAFFEQRARIDPAGRARLHKLALRRSRTISKINVASDGGLESIEQYALGTLRPGTRGSTRPEPIPVSRLVAYVHDREGGDWVGNSLLRPAYKHWLIKDRLLRVDAQTIDRNGMGVPLYEDSPDNEWLEHGRALATSWRSGDNAGAGIPHGAKLTLRGVEGNLPTAIPSVRYHDEQIARAVLAHVLNLGTSTGSWALGTVFADLLTLSLQTVAESIADTANAHVVEDLVDWNWGPDEPAPRIVFDEIGSRHQITAQAIKMLLDAGALSRDPALERHLRSTYGLPPADPSAPPEPGGDDAGDPAGAA